MNEKRNEFKEQRGPTRREFLKKIAALTGLALLIERYLNWVKTVDQKIDQKNRADILSYEIEDFLKKVEQEIAYEEEFYNERKISLDAIEEKAKQISYDSILEGLRNQRTKIYYWEYLENLSIQQEKLNAIIKDLEKRADAYKKILNELNNGLNDIKKFEKEMKIQDEEIKNKLEDTMGWLKNLIERISYLMKINEELQTKAEEIQKVIAQKLKLKIE